MKLKGINVTFILVAVSLVAVIGLIGTFASHQYWNLIWIAVLIAWLGIFLHTSTVGHLKVWQRLLDSLNLPKESRVLDLGAGRINDLLVIAKHLQAPGKVTGTGQWRQAQQTVQAQINAAQLADRVKLVDANVFNMNFTDRSFDYVFVDLAFHDITPAIERGRALQEAGRVMKPTGQLVILDFEHIAEYQQMLTNLGFHNLRVVNAGFNGWWGDPWLATKILIAQRS